MMVDTIAIPIAIRSRRLAGMASRRLSSRIAEMCCTVSGFQPAIWRWSALSSMSLRFVITQSLPLSVPLSALNMPSDRGTGGF